MIVWLLRWISNEALFHWKSITRNRRVRLPILVSNKNRPKLGKNVSFVLRIAFVLNVNTHRSRYACDTRRVCVGLCCSFVVVNGNFQIRLVFDIRIHIYTLAPNDVLLFCVNPSFHEIDADFNRIFINWYSWFDRFFCPHLPIQQAHKHSSIQSQHYTLKPNVRSWIT